MTEAHPLVSRMGTQNYMPPDGQMDMRADVYAAGLVIYEMLTGLSVDDFPSLGRQARRLRAIRSSRPCCGWCCGRASASPSNASPTPRPCSRNWPCPPKPRPVAAATVPDCRVSPCWPQRVGAWTLFPRHVEVSFVTEPFEATIYLDDAVLLIPRAFPIPRPAPSAISRRAPVTSNSSVRAGRVGMPASTTWPRRSRS